LHCWRQGGASFASFACGAAFEGLQCDFLLLAYWTHLFALNDEERHNGRHFLHIFSHAVYHVLQTILTTLWLGTRCPIPSDAVHPSLARSCRHAHSAPLEYLRVCRSADETHVAGDGHVRCD
jgi:hypothetical protein